jgi:hypothetical protein
MSWQRCAYFSTGAWSQTPSFAIVISFVYCSGLEWPGITALFRPSMPIAMAPERFTLAFSSRITLAFGFLTLAL